MSAVAITVPSVGESITEGTLARWLKPDGASVQSGDPLFELETEKASTVVPAAAAGVLKIGAAEGQTVAVGATVGTIEPRGIPSGAQIPPPRAGAARREADGAAEGKRPTPLASIGQVEGRSDETHLLSPAVRRLITEEGVDVASVPATGPGGRLTKGDVLSYLESPAAESGTASGVASVAPFAPSPASQPALAGMVAAPAPVAVSAQAPAPVAGPAPVAAPAAQTAPRPGAARETRERMSTLRQRISQRLLEAQNTAAILTTFNEADMSRVMELRARFKEPFQARHGVGLGFMSFFVKAAIEALKAYPLVNARIEQSDVVYQHFYDIGVAVTTDRGLVVPVVRDADRLSFAAIEKAIADFASKARAGTITVGDLQGGTFTITNGGVFGSLLSTPILNPPQSAILGMHAMKQRPVVVADEIVIRPMMYLALSYDHRLIDGRDAVGFLVRVKDCIENPERMMFEV
jgi:2-oxoglutarate dehydrogenase E2 component (dihydrolipoamide succinyltransferase)